MKDRLKSQLNKFFPLIAVGLFIVLWLVAAKAIGIEMVLPTPKVTFQNLFRLMGEKLFWSAVSATLLRSLISFFLAFAAALILAVVSFFVRPVHFFIAPIVSILRSTPTMSIILLSLIWMTDSQAPMFIASLIVFPLMYASFYGSLISVDKSLIKMSNIYNISPLRQAGSLYLPAILPSALVTIESTISLNLKIIIASEVLAQTRGSMGNLMQLSKVYLDTAELLAWTAAAIVISFLLEVVIRTIKKFAVRW